MLPKLQDLHDARRVIFFLGTNFLANIDMAVRRPGRFDHILLYDRPDFEGRRLIISRIVGSDQLLSAEQLQSAALRTAGWMTREVVSYAKSLLGNPTEHGDSSLPDYLDRCKKVGPKELKSSGLDKVTIKAVTDRWRSYRRPRELTVKAGTTRKRKPISPKG